MSNHATLPRDLSPWQMFLHADWVVQTVMIGLAVASLATWTVLLAKQRQLQREARSLQAAAATLASAQSLPTASSASTQDNATAATLLAEALDELQRAPSRDNPEGVKERVGSRLQRIELAHARQLRSGIGLLATIGATAPFVGLFGTVWGIMNSFIGIAQSNTTNLAVVAPGIAEALLATALGLVAAIPAVVIYNHLSRRLAALRGLTGDLSAGVQQLVSRDLDRLAANADGAR